MIKFPEEMQKRIDKGCCGAWIGQGWMPIAIELDEKLAEVNPDYTIEQIKQKFGGLRYYVANIDYYKINDLIEAAYHKAEVTCEMCGEPGKLVNHGGMRTLCEKHTQESI